MKGFFGPTENELYNLSVQRSLYFNEPSQRTCDRRRFNFRRPNLV